MAKIRLGAPVGDIRKSQGATTYSKNRYGAYIRMRSAPVQPRTARQLARRSALTVMSGLYRAMTDIQREAWNVYGSQMSRLDSLGIIYTLSGMNAFMAVNGIRESFGQAVTQDASVLVAPPVIGVPDVVIDATDVDLIWADADATTGTQLQIWATGPRSQGKTFVRGIKSNGRMGGGDARLLFSGDMPAPIATFHTISIAAEYQAQFGVPIASARVSFFVVPITDNYVAGTPARYDATVA